MKNILFSEGKRSRSPGDASPTPVTRENRVCPAALPAPESEKNRRQSIAPIEFIFINSSLAPVSLDLIYRGSCAEFPGCHLFSLAARRGCGIGELHARTVFLLNRFNT